MNYLCLTTFLFNDFKLFSNFLTPIQTEFFQFLSSLCVYLSDIHNLKNNSAVSRSGWLHVWGKPTIFRNKYFAFLNFLNWRYFSEIWSISKLVVYKSNAYVYGRRCFITAFLIIYHAKKRRKTNTNLLWKFLGSPAQRAHHETLLKFVAIFSW